MPATIITTINGRRAAAVANQNVYYYFWGETLQDQERNVQRLAESMSYGQVNFNWNMGNGEIFDLSPELYGVDPPILTTEGLVSDLFRFNNTLAYDDMAVAAVETNLYDEMTAAGRAFLEFLAGLL